MSALLARRLPRLHSGYERFRSSRLGHGARWTWTHRRTVAFGLALTYAGTMYLVYKYELKQAVAVRPNTWLVWKFYPGSIVDVKGSPSLAYLVAAPTTGEDPPHVMTVFEAVLALKRAAVDPNVVGIFADFSTLHWPSSIQGDGLGLAQTEELMQAIHEFKMAKQEQQQEEQQQQQQQQQQQERQEEELKASAIEGKDSRQEQSGDVAAPPPPPPLPSTIAFTDDFASQATYLLASVFEKVYLQASGGVPLVGVSSTLPFFARLLSKLGVKMHTEARTHYKSMVSMYTQDESLPKLQAENQAELLGELSRSVAFGIGINRFGDLPEEEATDKATKIMQQGPYSGPEALQVGLVDGLAYKSDIMHMIRSGQPAPRNEKERHDALLRDDVPKFRGLAEYAHWMQKAIDDSLHHDSVVDVAVCHLRGTISSASGDWSASSVVKGLREAAQDDNVRVILLRVDSGGGSVTSSDSIWAAIKHVRETYGKPVIVSFGNVAASGGYYIATAADAIYASETTITGSIGVAGARPTVTRKLLDRAGIGLQTYLTGAKGGSLFHQESPEERARASKHIDETYEDFLQKVCQGRGISRDVVEEIAGGQVFTGLTAWTRTDPAAWEEKQAALATHQHNSPLAEAMRALAQGAEEVLHVSDLSSALRAIDDDPAHTEAPPKVALAGATDPQRKPESSVSKTAQWHLEDVTEPDQINTQRISMRAAPSSPPPQPPSSEHARTTDAPDFQTSLVDAFNEHQERIFQALEQAVKACDDKVRQLSAAVSGETRDDAAQSLQSELARLAQHSKISDALTKVLEAVGTTSTTSPPPSSPPSSSTDPAEAAHLAAAASSSSPSSAAEQASAAEARALASASSASPFGKGLIDSIGGMYDAAMLAATWTLHAETEEMRASHPGMSYAEAQRRIRPRCVRVALGEGEGEGRSPEAEHSGSSSGSSSASASASASGSEGGSGSDASAPNPAQTLDQAWELNVRLVQYPRQRSFRERIREMGGSGGYGGAPGFALPPSASASASSSSLCSPYAGPASGSSSAYRAYPHSSSALLDPSAWLSTLRAELSAALAQALVLALGSAVRDPVGALGEVVRAAEGAGAGVEGRMGTGRARVEDEGVGGVGLGRARF